MSACASIHTSDKFGVCCRCPATEPARGDCDAIRTKDANADVEDSPKPIA